MFQFGSLLIFQKSHFKAIFLGAVIVKEENRYRYELLYHSDTENWKTHVHDGSYGWIEYRNALNITVSPIITELTAAINHLPKALEAFKKSYSILSLFLP